MFFQKYSSFSKDSSLDLMLLAVSWRRKWELKWRLVISVFIWYRFLSCFFVLFHSYLWIVSFFGCDAVKRLDLKYRGWSNSYCLFSVQTKHSQIVVVSSWAFQCGLSMCVMENRKTSVWTITVRSEEKQNLKAVSLGLIQFSFQSMEKLWASVFIKVYPNTQMFLE